MAVTVRQIVWDVGTDPDTLTLPITGATGDYLLLAASFVASPGGTPSGSVTDTLGNTWVEVVSDNAPTAGGRLWVGIFRCANANVSGSSQVTLTDVNGEGGYFVATLYELEGAGAGVFTSTFDTKPGTGTAVATDAPTWASPDDAVFGIGVVELSSCTWTPGAGLTTGAELEATTVPRPTFSSAYKLGITSATNVTWTIGTSADSLGAAVNVKQFVNSPSLVPNLFPRIPRTSLTR